MITPDRVKGTRDFGPEDMLLRQRVVGIIRIIYEARGFVPIDTPALEKWEVLSAKGAGGDELLKETYNFEDLGSRRIGLRYDLTVPLIRYVSMNPNIPMPFKRYHYGPVWRYEESKPGRYREFYQFDIDTVGSQSMAADAECIATVAEALSKFRQYIGDFKIRINNRKLVEGVLNYLDITSEEQVIGEMRTIDKIQKLSREGLFKEFKTYKISAVQAERILDSLSRKGEIKQILSEMKKDLPKNEKIAAGLSELEETEKYLGAFGVLANCIFDASLVRGLGYYTGNVFEATLEGKNSGSIAGGGRYDKVIGLFLGKDVPAVGFSIGIERLLDLMKGKITPEPLTEIFVAAVSQDLLPEAIKISEKLRTQGKRVQFDLMGRNFSNQLKFADKIGAKEVWILGPRDMAKGEIVVKDMKTGKEERVKINSLINN
ncbi:Histidine--tRNA ligase [uncultured archaeon]|nr:Histidine--tRNA ligase [uncultured archaeon]